MSMTVIRSVDMQSPAHKAGIRAGEKLVQVNGHPIIDVLDYKFYTYDSKLSLVVEKADGKQRTVKVRKSEGEDLGLEFETYLMDKARCCANRCIFCFVDQLPKGMRDTLYFKDDDARLSFLMGNYITLTNLSPRELDRIVELRVSPINISVHATEPELRAMMLGHRNGGKVMEIMQRFAQAHITMNCQIVLCPGVNDGDHLKKSMEDLAALYPYVKSVSVVPVGLTCHREGLFKLEPYYNENASAVVDMVEGYADKCLEKYGSRIFWCSDELYLRAGRAIPEDEYFEDYTQLENGVGMLRLLRTEFDCALRLADSVESVRPFSAACGVDAADWIREIVDSAAEKCNTKGNVYPIVNHFFGETITVSGLVTGSDLIAQLKGLDLGERLLIPINMLRHGEDVFLDDVTLSDVARELNVEVIPVSQDGYDLCDAIFDVREGGL